MGFDMEKLKEENTDINTIKEFGEASIPKKKNKEKGNIHCLTIIGEIEGHIISPPQTKTTKYEHIIPQIVEMHDNDEIDGVLIILNTVGGDVEAGLAISELISSMDKPTVSLVLGGGHSIGVPLAVSTDYSFIAPSASMTIHPVRVNGTVIGAPQTYDYFEKMQERILNFVANNSKIPKEKLKSLMLDTEQMARDVGTVLIGEDAVKEGLIDEAGGLKKAMDKLYEMIKNKRQERSKSKKKAQI